MAVRVMRVAVVMVANRVEALRRRQRVRLEIGLDRWRQRQRVDRIDAGAAHDRAAAELLQGQHCEQQRDAVRSQLHAPSKNPQQLTFVRAPDALHAVAMQRHARQLAERFAYVEIAQRRDLEVGHLVALRVQLRLLGGHLPLERQMEPIADQHLGHAGRVLGALRNEGDGFFV